MYVIMTGTVRVLVRTKTDEDGKSKNSLSPSIHKKKDTTKKNPNYKMSSKFIFARRMLKKKHRRTIYPPNVAAGKNEVKRKGKRQSLAKSVLAKFRPKTGK